MDTQKRGGGRKEFFPLDYDDIYLDTCTLMEEDFRLWLRQNLPELLKAGKKLVIPHAVERELAYLAQGVTSNCCREAGRAGELARRLVQTGVAECRGDRTISQQADLYLMKTASAERFGRKIAVITQDRQLTRDLQLLNRIGSAKPIHTYKLEQGVLVSTDRTSCIPPNRANNAAQIYRQLNL